MVSGRATVAAVALAALFLAISLPASQATLLPVAGGWVYGNPYYPVPCVCDGQGHLRPWIGADIIGTVDIALVKSACQKANIVFYENIHIYFFAGGNNNYCWGSIRPYFNFDLVVQFAETANFGPSCIWNACHLFGFPGFGYWWGK